MSRLEELCRPFLTLVCERCLCASAGASPDPSVLKEEVKAALEGIRNACADDPLLRREFARIEKPLVFFADYCFKEGETPLAQGWRELGREYNELSGDEKFYDLLADTLEDPDAGERLRLFYVMLGLGFDGVHRGDGAYISRRMKLCATRFTPPEPAQVRLFADVGTAYPRLARRSRALAVTFVCALAFAAGAFAVNYYRFCRITQAYSASVSEACSQANQPSVRTEPQEGR